MDNAIALRTEAQAIDAVKTMANIVLALRRDVLQKDVDYGVIPGTGDKPTLLLPGMEKLMRALNAIPEYIEKCVIRDYDRPLFHYEYECRLIDVDTGMAIPGGRGIGLCTSYESAFRYRKSERVCPKCGKPTVFKSKDKPEWYCWRKKDGCGATFPENDIQITSQQVGRIENPDIFDQVNAIMKRAKKRSLGDAVKGAASVSEFFTVDLEEFARFDDIVEGQYAEVEEKPVVAKTEVIKVEKPQAPPPVVEEKPHDPNEWYNGNIKAWGDKWMAKGMATAQLMAALKISEKWTDFKGTVASADEAVEAYRKPVSLPPEVAAAKAAPIVDEKPAEPARDANYYAELEAQQRRDAAASLTNEAVTIHRVTYKPTRNGMGAPCWEAVANDIAGASLPIVVWEKDVKAIKAAGYDFPKTDGGGLDIMVTVEKSNSKWHIKSVLPKDEPEPDMVQGANPFGSKPAIDPDFEALPSAFAEPA